MRNFALFIAVILLSSVAFAAGLPIVNPNFAVPPIACGGNYAYQTFGGDCGGPLAPQQDFNGTSGFGWTFGPDGNGLTGPGTAFNPPNNIPFYQAAFLQGAGASVSQSIPGFVASQEYQLSFYLGSRYNSGCCDGNQTVEALIDGNVIGTWSLVSFTPFTLTTVDFSVATGGNHTLDFLGLANYDSTAFITQTAINPIPEPSSLLMLASGIVGVGGLLRRKIG